MFKSSRWLLMLISGVFLSTNIAWANFPMAAPPPSMRGKPRFLAAGSLEAGYDIQKEKTLAGVIEAISTSKSGSNLSNYMVEITLRGKSQKVCMVELGPYWYIQSQHFKLPKGGKVKVKGFVKPEGDNYRMLATVIINADHILKLRNKMGVPRWGIKPQLRDRRLSDNKVAVNQPSQSLDDDTPAPDTERPADYGPPQWEEELPWWLAWIAQSLNFVLGLMGGPGSALLIMLVLLMGVLIRSFTPKKRHWRHIKAKSSK